MASADWWHDQAQDLDAPHAKSILGAYRSAYATGIQPALEGLKAKITDYEARTGKTAPASWLLQQDRLRQINYQVSNKLSEFKGIVAGEVKDAKIEAVGLAEKASGDLVGALSSVPPGVVEEIVGTSADGKTPLGELMNDFVPDAQKAIRQELINHAVLGRSPAETAAALRHQLGIPLTRAMTMVRTETARAYTNASLAQYRANPAIVWGWRWLTAEDDRVCEYCGPLDQSPHPTDEDMDTHPNCRCAVAPITMDEAMEEGLDTPDQTTAAAVDENDPSTWTKDWFDNQDVMKQVDILLDMGLTGLNGVVPWTAFQQQFAANPQWKFHEPKVLAAPPPPPPAAALSKRVAGAREFSTRAEVQKWANAHWYASGKTGPWDTAARGSITSYTASAYHRINSQLRTGQVYDSGVAKMVENIDRGLAAFPVPEAVKVFRGVGTGAFGGNKPVVGQVYNDKGYMSTSPNINDAWPKEVMLEMHVPAGTPGAYVAPISAHEHENELLLGRDLDYVVTGTTERPNSWGSPTTWYIVEVIPR